MWRTFSDDDSSDESSSPTIVRHKRVSPSNSHPIPPMHHSKLSIVEIDGIRGARERDGYTTSDGLPTRKTAGADDMYGETWLNEEVAKRRLLSQHPYYRLAVMVAGASNTILDVFTDEGETTREVQRRIQMATREVQEMRRRQQDTRAEQDRAAALKTQSDQLRSKIADMRALQGQIDASSECYLRGLSAFSKERASSLIMRENVWMKDPVPPSIGAFDYFTRASVVRNGPAGYQKTSKDTKAIVQIAAQKQLSEAGAGAPNALRISDDMPQTSTLSLSWATLFACYRNSVLLDIIEKNAVFLEGTDYHASPGMYVEDLVILGSIIFREESSGTDNLLVLENISLLFWAHVNKMVRRGGSLIDPIPRPLPKTKSTRKRAVKVQTMTVTFDVAEEDLGAAAAGQNVVGIDQQKFRELQKTLMTNVAQLQMLPALIDIMEHMYDSVYPYLFYVDTSGEASFAGGHVDAANVRNVFLNNPTSGIFPSLFFVSYEIMKRSISSEKWPPKDMPLLGDAESWPAIWESMRAVMFTSSQIVERYTRNAQYMYLDSYGVLRCMANFFVLANRVLPYGGFTAAALAAMKKYTETPGHPPEEVIRIFSMPRADFAGAVIASTVPDLPYLKTLHVLVEHHGEVTKAISEGVRVEEATRKQIDDQYALLQNRITEFLKTTQADEAESIRAILERDSTPSAEEAMRPANSGVLFFTPVFTAAFSSAESKINLYICCIMDTYTTDSLVRSDMYAREFAALVAACYRLNSVRSPDRYTHDASEARSRVEVRSAIEDLRTIAKRDRYVRHTPSCGCSVGIHRKPRYGGFL